MATVVYAFRLTEDEKVALQAIAAREQRTPADTLRRLIRANARRRGLLVVESFAQAVEPQKVAA